MNKYLSTVIIALLVLASACMDHGNYNVTIEGSLPGFSDRQVILSEVEPHAARAIDTALIAEDGAFGFKFNIDEPGIYLLKVDHKNSITLIIHPDTSIMLKGTGIPLRSHYEVEGSHGSFLLQQFESRIDRARTAIDSLKKAYGWTRQTPISGQGNKELKEAYNLIFSSYKDYTARLIEANPSSLATLIMINRRLGNQVIFADDEDFYYYALTDSALVERYPGNKHVIDHHQRIEKIRYEMEAMERARERLAIGRPAPDFKMESPGGREISLSSLKGKTVLLYFWAAWDASSRQANAVLVKAYEKYMHKGFAVYAVSLDNYKEMWEGAIRTDKLSWINVSDLQNIFSPAVFLYQVPKKLPYFYILDQDQKIMMRSNDVAAVISALDRQFEDLFPGTNTKQASD